MWKNVRYSLLRVTGVKEPVIEELCVSDNEISQELIELFMITEIDKTHTRNDERIVIRIEYDKNVYPEDEEEMLSSKPELMHFEQIVASKLPGFAEWDLPYDDNGWGSFRKAVIEYFKRQSQMRKN